MKEKLNVAASEPWPKSKLVLLLPFFSSVTFLYQLQTSITQLFLKPEHFLRLFLKTRSHDGYTDFLHCFYQTGGVVIGYTKTQLKNLISGMVVNWPKYVFL